MQLSTVLSLVFFTHGHGQSLKWIIDHQFDAPGDPNGVFDSRFNDPEALKSYGYNAKAGRYAEAAVSFDTLPGGPWFPKGNTTRSWMDGYAKALKNQMTAAKAAGLTVLNHMDFIALPRTIVEANAAKICVPPQTAPPCLLLFNDVMKSLLATMFDEMFEIFPELDGLLIRTGEHYVVDLPYHVAGRPHPPDGTSPFAVLQWLRDEVAAKRGKIVVYRTWSVHPVNDAKGYLTTSAAVQPHPNCSFP